MFLAEIDPVQIVIIVIAMAAGFVQWVWGLIQQSRANLQRQAEDGEDEEMERLREEAWRRQVAAEKPVPMRPSPHAPPPVSEEANPWTVIREILEKAQEASKPPPPRQAPPPLPAQPIPQTPVRQSEPQSRPAHFQVAKAAKNAPPPPKMPVLPAQSFPASRKARTESSAVELAALLTRPQAIRQAVLLREILGPPKALQSAADAPR